VADLKKLYDAILNGDATAAAEVTRQAIDEKLDPSTLISDTMVPAMAEVGRLYECEDYFVPELLLSARAMKAAVTLLRPLLVASGAEPVGRVVIGTVQGDLHDIGKNLVASMLEGGGFEVTDLGVDVSAEKFVAAVKEKQPHIVCLSGLLTVTIPGMKTIIEAVQRAGLRDQVKILVGGAPVTPEYAREIGADGYGENASAAVKVAKQIRAGRPAA
jgi:corrinoid protein of di/trimethylamine methyltransferase